MCTAYLYVYICFSNSGQSFTSAALDMLNCSRNLISFLYHDARGFSNLKCEHEIVSVACSVYIIYSESLIVLILIFQLSKAAKFHSGAEEYSYTICYFSCSRPRSLNASFSSSSKSWVCFPKPLESCIFIPITEMIHVCPDALWALTPHSVMFGDGSWGVWECSKTCVDVYLGYEQQGGFLPVSPELYLAL